MFIFDAQLSKEDCDAETGTACAFVGSEPTLSLFVESLLGGESNSQGHLQLSPLEGARADTVVRCINGVCFALGGKVGLAGKDCSHCSCRLSHHSYRSYVPFDAAVALEG